MMLSFRLEITDNAFNLIKCDKWEKNEYFK